MTAIPEAAADMRATIILPASNEAAYIEACLDALLAQEGVAGGVQVLVIANGCRDATAARARAFAGRLAARGWQLAVIELDRGSKIAALNAGDAHAVADLRIYLDADVRCDPGLVADLLAALATAAPAYATGRLRIAPPQSRITRAYAGFWVRLPFVAQGATGAGLFAVNAAGRARWGAFPDVISDDTFVRVHFRPDERHEVASGYRWPMVEGLRALVRVRRRQDAGVRQIAQLYPGLMENEAKAPLGIGALLGLAARAPVGFAVYMLVWVLCRMGRSDGQWTRGR